MISPRKWQQLTFPQQMGNIGSELSRALNWENRDDPAGRDRALERALDLLDLTLASHHQGGRLRELNRFREAVAAWYVHSREYANSPKLFVDYCLQLTALRPQR